MAGVFNILFLIDEEIWYNVMTIERLDEGNRCKYVMTGKEIIYNLHCFCAKNWPDVETINP